MRSNGPQKQVCDLALQRFFYIVTYNVPPQFDPSPGATMGESPVLKLTTVCSER